MKRIMAVLAVFSAALICAPPAFAAHIVAPTLSVTANHLGGGLVQYTLTANNPAGGVITVEVRALGAFNQIDAMVPVFAGGSGALDPVDSFQLAQAADFFDAAYNAADGINTDSYWDDTDLSTPNPPFGGAQGGAVGSTQYDYSAGSPALVDVFGTRIAQLVVLDPAALAFAVGDVTPFIVDTPGIAQIDLVDARPMVNGPSLIASQGENYSINGTIALVPEPSTLALLGIGFMAFVVLIRRR